MKIARVTPIFKTGDKTLVTNYRPISILPCFSKLLERIMYNRVYNHLNEFGILYKKQFGFQKAHSTEHAILQLQSMWKIVVEQIHEAFKSGEFTLAVFIDLSKAFDTVDHQILVKKLEKYGLSGEILEWFSNYLTNRKQFIEYGNCTKKTWTNFELIKCGVPQGSILGPLLFLMYVNDIMFADDTNFFFSHKNIKTLFEKTNNELKIINEWFKSNKLSLNMDKTNYIFFHRSKQKDTIPLKLPKLSINNTKIKRVTTTKFLGTLIDEHLTWKNISASLKVSYLKTLE